MALVTGLLVPGCMLESGKPYEPMRPLEAGELNHEEVTKNVEAIREIIELQREQERLSRQSDSQGPPEPGALREEEQRDEPMAEQVEVAERLLSTEVPPAEALLMPIQPGFLRLLLPGRQRAMSRIDVGVEPIHPYDAPSYNGEEGSP